MKNRLKAFGSQLLETLLGLLWLAGFIGLIAVCFMLDRCYFVVGL